MPVLAAFVMGVVLCGYGPVLSGNSAGLLLLAGVAAVCSRGRWRRAWWLLAALLLGLSYASWRAEWRLAQTLPADWQQRPIELVGVVRGLPDASEFGWRLTLQVERVLTAGVTVPSRVQLTDYRGGNWPAGSRWQLTVRLKQRHASANPYGFDAEQWMWSEGLLASGAIGKNPQRLADADDVRARIDRLRAAVVARIEQALGPGREAALIAALTVGDQQGIDRADWALFARTGLTHLVSISGLHITMVAGLAGLLARALLRRWPTRRVPPRVMVAGVTLAVATFYAVLAGLSVPTQRTLFMLAVVVLMLLWRRASSPFQIWWLALTLVLLLDPFAVLAPGLWLSFGLVAALMASTLGRRRPPGKWRAALAGQWAVLVMSLVPLLVFFGNVPLLSPLANALAIPLVSGLLTPLSLLAVALPWDGGLQLAAAVVRLFYLGVDWLAQWPPWSLPGQPWPLLALALGGTCWLIAPRGVPGRALGACLLLPLLVFRPTLPAPGQLRVTVLDVGQGLAVLLQTARHNLLFDTGPGEAGRIVLPQLAGLGVERLDTVLLSHHDNDHDGAAASLLAGIKVGRILAGQPQSLAEMGLRGSACLRGQSWVWDGVRFDVLSPGAQEMAADDNSHSCVLRVATRQQAIMLSGDAPQAVESELVRRYGPALGSTVLVAGHHGSKTSSADDWLAALHPAWLVVSAGYLNRYHHPHPSVLARVQQAAIPVLRTDLDGAITLQLGVTTVPSCYRTAARRYWRAEGDCGAPPAAGRRL